MKWLYFSYFTHEDIEAQRNYITYQGHSTCNWWILSQSDIQGTKVYFVPAKFQA